MDCGLVSQLMTIPKKSNFHEEIHEVDHHENVAFFGKLVKSTALGALAAGTGETTIVRGLKYSSNIGAWPEVLSADAIAVSSSKLTWMVSMIFQIICVRHVLWAKARNNHINLNLKTSIRKTISSTHGSLWAYAGCKCKWEKYILVIVDDYSRFTWVKFLASKDEAPDFIIKFLKMIQVILNATIKNIRTDNGTEFVNQTLRDYYEQVGISHETSVVRTPQQNGVVERRNCTLIEAAHTKLIFAQALLFL
nr:retrovirus-related Pol polyprotein from transposon TNT 1-94 [Tanacetum cinerariifolium]